MAEDYGDKTEAPTARRRQEAREEGQIARSPDLTAAVLLLGTVVLLNWYGPGVVRALRTLMAEMLAGGAPDGATQIGTAIIRSLLTLAGAMAPLLVGLVIIAILVNVAQVGLLLNG